MKFDIIYADPPWSFTTWSDKGKKKSPDNHYQILNIEDIKGLNVQGISNDNSILALWVTAPLFREGLDTLKSWGFEYKTFLFTWVKTNKKSPGWFWGLGYYTRSNPEFCILGTRGKPLERLSHSIHSVVDSPVAEHSKKPDIVRNRLVDLFGDRPRVELFARNTYEGWVCLGNEINGNDIRKDLDIWMMTA
jgi:N6-adenosine-specific RNA methylase IME4